MSLSDILTLGRTLIDKAIPRMKTIIATFLQDKAARNSSVLAALLVTSVTVGGPWSG